MVGGEVIETPSAVYKTAVINQYTNRPLKIHSKIKSFLSQKDNIIIPKIFGVDSYIRSMTYIHQVYRAPNDKDFELYYHRKNHQLIVLLFCDFFLH